MLERRFGGNFIESSEWLEQIFAVKLKQISFTSVKNDVEMLQLRNFPTSTNCPKNVFEWLKIFLLENIRAENKDGKEKSDLSF